MSKKKPLTEEQRERRRKKKKLRKQKSNWHKRQLFGPSGRPAPVMIKYADGTEETMKERTKRRRRERKKGRRKISPRLDRLARASGYKDYAAYLRSDVWKALRRSRLVHDGWRCVRCPEKDDLQVHHREYPTFLGLETVEMLETLCFGCHVKHHKH